jgi:muconolactone delta-isomerase
MTADNFFEGELNDDFSSREHKVYMVNVKFSRFTNEFAALVPAHRSVVNTLMSEGVITDYALAEDRSRLWMVVRAVDEQAVYTMLGQLPLRKFMTPEVHELMFHNKAFVQFPAFSLN